MNILKLNFTTFGIINLIPLIIIIFAAITYFVMAKSGSSSPKNHLPE